MASNCVKHKPHKKNQTLYREEVVISGMAGKFPESKNVYQFRDNLFNKVNLITEGYHRWKSSKIDVSHKAGRLKDVFDFDAGFFGIRKRLANHMDVYHKLLLESAYEVILDAGYHPTELAGTNTGVFIAATLSDGEYCILNNTQDDGSHSLIGATRSMIAQEISYFFQLQGPSYTNDCGCSSSMYALEHAYRSIREGICDMAIVGGANLMLLPEVTLDFLRLGIIAKDGRCKPFDKNANGYVRAESVSTLFLQKSKNARRIYAHLVHSKLNCDGYRQQDIAHPSSVMQTVLMNEVYNEGNVDLSDVCFLEAHGNGTNIGDMEELTAISNVFCLKRKSSLYIGAVKSNAGHSESAAAMLSIIKVLIAMECGFIPPNMNYLEPREDISALVRGQLKVVTEKILWPKDKGIAGINGLGIGGSNGHLILRRNEKVKANLGVPQDDLPRLVCASGRTKNAVNIIWEDLSSRCLDVEFVSLLHSIFKKSTSNHQFRGYQILSKVGEVKRSWKEVNAGKSKLALVFNNFETHWPKIGKQLMAFPVFMKTLETVRSKTICKLNLDIVNLLTRYTDETKINQILANMTVQICLAEILKSIGITSDYVIGLGTGELIAAYFEDRITLRDIVHGLLLFEDENNEDNNFLSTSNTYFKDWLISASQKKNTLFSESSIVGIHKTRKALLTDCEILVIGAEIKDFECLSLIRENSQDCVLDLLTVLGRLYEKGYDLNLENLYPKTTWPVSRGTPMISPLVNWNHNQNSDVAFHEPIRKRQHIVDIDLKNEDWKFLDGHVIDGKNIFPPSAYIFLVWEALGVMKGKPISKLKVIFEEIKFVEVIDLANQDNIKLIINIMEGSYRFEITQHEATIVTGKVCEVVDTQQVFADLPEAVVDESDEIITLTQAEIYRELRIRGYNYKGRFKSIETIVGKKKGLVKWTGNYTTFLDSLMQVLTLHVDTRSLYLPFSIKQFIIDPVKHMEVVDEKNEETLVSIEVYHDLGIIRARGTELWGLKGISASRQNSKSPILECHKFVPNVTSLSLTESVRVIIQIITENNRVARLKSLELPGESQLISPLIVQLVDGFPQIQAEVAVFSKDLLGHSGVTFEEGDLKEKKENLLLVILTRAFERKEMLQDGLAAVKRTNGYVLTREQLNFNFSNDAHHGLDVLCIHSTESEKLVLLRESRGYEQPTVVNVSNDLSWLPKAQDVIKRAQPLALYSQNQFTSGILGLATCLRKEPNGDCVSCFFIIDDAPPFDPNHPFYEKQIAKHMAMNVWKEGKWGSYRHLLLKENTTARTNSSYAIVTVPGDLAGINFVEANRNNTDELASSLKIIYVYWSSLHFRDALRVSGRIPVDTADKNVTSREHVLGLEFSGRDIAGKRVMGLTTKGALATQTVTESTMIWTVPEDWSLEDAATVPGTYLTVIYALMMKVKIKRGQYILIHFGDGSVSQAAINIALHFGCTIFIIVDTEEEMSFLRENYPQIQESHILYSRDSLFGETILQETKDQGVDIVLNPTLTEFSISVRCLARQGDFFEIDNYGKNDYTKLKTRLLQYGINFHNVLLESLITSAGVSAPLSRHFSDLLHQGAIRPISRIAFKMEQVADAFEFITTEKYTGKVLVNIRKDEEHFACTLKNEVFSALPRFYCDRKSTYIIIGGLGGFGLQLTNWLVSRGARKIVLNTRTGLKSGYQAMLLRLWQSYDAHVSVRTDDVTIKEGCTELIAYANSLGPVKAIFNLALVLRDALFEDQSVESFKISIAPKAMVTQNLDTISRSMCPELRYFVVFSSGSCGRGNTMQSNYGFANSIMERICEKRKTDGFPALAIQWGPIGDVGAIVAIQEKTDRDLKISGTFPQIIFSCLQILDKLLLQDETVVGSIIVAEKDMHSENNVLSSLLNILGIRDLAKVNLHLGLAEFGMNSIMNTEIKQVLETELELFLSSDEINSMTLANLQDMASNRN